MADAVEKGVLPRTSSSESDAGENEMSTIRTQQQAAHDLQLKKLNQQIEQLQVDNLALSAQVTYQNVFCHLPCTPCWDEESLNKHLHCWCVTVRLLLVQLSDAVEEKAEVAVEKDELEEKFVDLKNSQYEMEQQLQHIVSSAESLKERSASPLEVNRLMKKAGGENLLFLSPLQRKVRRSAALWPIAVKLPAHCTLLQTQLGLKWSCESSWTTCHWCKVDLAHLRNHPPTWRLSFRFLFVPWHLAYNSPLFLGAGETSQRHVGWDVFPPVHSGLLSFSIFGPSFEFLAQKS